MKYLQPLYLKNKYWESVEEEVKKIFERLIYDPIFAAINETEREYRNARDPLGDAIRAGTVDYDGAEIFSGHFNAAISRQLKSYGGVFNKLTKSWKVPKLRIPTTVSFAQAAANARFDTLKRKIIKSLSDAKIDSVIYYEAIREKYERTIFWMNDDFKKSVAAITIPPVLTPEQARNLATSWTNNLQLFIRGWTQKEVVKLRGQVQENAFIGQRSQSMVKMIEDSYGVMRSKAKFLARQETTLLMSKFREQKFKEVGVTRYRWLTSNDERVRHDHKELNGKVFDWSQPPVVDRKTGRRANAGEDFNCRCVARPIWDGET